MCTDFHTQFFSASASSDFVKSPQRVNLKQAQDSLRREPKRKKVGQPSCTRSSWAPFTPNRQQQGLNLFDQLGVSLRFQPRLN